MRRVILVLMGLSGFLAACPKKAVLAEEAFAPPEDYPEGTEGPGLPEGPDPGPTGPNDPRR